MHMQHVIMDMRSNSRQVLLFPSGNRRGSKMVSIYVKCVLPQAHPAATCALVVVNSDNGKTIQKGVPHSCICQMSSSLTLNQQTMLLVQRQDMCSHHKKTTGDLRPLQHKKCCTHQMLAS